MRKFRLLLVAFFIINIMSFTYAGYYDYLDISSFLLETDATFGYLSNRTLDGWVHDSGINYKYDTSAGTGEWKDGGYQEFSTYGVFRISEHLEGEFLFDIYGGHYNSIWKPVNDINNLRDEKKYFRLKKTNLVYLKDPYQLRYFQGMAHYNWSQEGDVFDFYKSQFETDRYLDISGRAVPQGLEFEARSDYGNIDLVYGEPIWGSKDSVYCKYNYRFGAFDNHLLYKREKLPWETTDEEKYKEAYALTSKLDYTLPFFVELGALYQPFRVNDDYEYVENVAAGAGYLGSTYLKKEAKTKTEDALGYSVSLHIDELVLLDNLNFKYQYLDILAGNKKEFSVSLQKGFLGKFFFFTEIIDREPIIGPNPFIYEGTEDNKGPAYILPRGENSPFWVDESNRKASILKFNLSYIPSSATDRLYIYEPGNLKTWNINRDPNTRFSCALGYKMAKYPTTTDFQYYFNEDGIAVWENYMGSGLWATDEFLHSYSFLIKSYLEPKFNILLLIKGGDSLSTSGIAYDSTDPSVKPITTSFDVDLNIDFRPYTLELLYGKDSWGPEDWHRRFGITLDNMYKIKFSKDFEKWGELGLSYMKVEQDDYKTSNPIDLPSFEEFMVEWTYKFNGVFFFKGDPYKHLDSGGAPEDANPPQIDVSSDSNILTPNDDGIDDTITFRINIDDVSGIDDWHITIRNVLDDKLIFEKWGKGLAPLFFEWDGITDKSYPEGPYYFQIEATDVLGHSATSKKIEFNIERPQKLADKTLVDKIRKYATVSEDARGIIISFPIDSLYNKKKDVLKKDAVARLRLVTEFVHSSNFYKIRVEAHTDNTGRELSNKKFTKNLASDIAGILQRYGVAPDSIENIGFGSDRPLYSNKTLDGRQNNNRIDIVIMQ